MTGLQGIIFVVFQTAAITKSSFVNKFVLDVKTVEVCPDNDMAESPITNLKYVKINRTHRALSFDVTYVNTFGDNVGAIMTVSKWSATGGWKAIPFIPFQADMCGTYLKHFRGLWVQFTTAMGVEHPDQCPIPPGSYSVKNFIMDYSLMPVPLWDGRFRVVNAGKRVDTGRLVQCLTYEVEIHPLV